MNAHFSDMEQPHTPSCEESLNSSRKRKGRNFINTSRDYEKVASLGLNTDDNDIDLKVRELSFNNLYEAEQFYIAYGREIGFDIRRENYKRRSTLWVCHRAGFKRERDELSRKRQARPVTRIGCKALLRVGYEPSSKRFLVREFEPDHNHDPATGEEASLLRCNRYLTSLDKTVLTIFTKLRIRPCKAMDVIQSFAGEGGKLSFKRKDAYNFLYKEKMKLINNGDVNMALHILRGMKCHDSGFVIRYTENYDGALTSLFWCDSQSKAEYEAYGDVLVLDSTYNTNQYRFPLVIFSGANNHGSNTIFGAGILCSEGKPSYLWLLRTFIEAMDYKHPVSILTDQDNSICDAIAQLFPGVRHRLCSWHLCRNAKQKVNRGDFACQFVRLAKRKCSVEEFETLWAALIQDYGVTDIPWVNETYNKKEKWSEAYFPGVFFAGMTTTQRAESVNSLMKLYLEPSLSITEFVQNFHRALCSMRSKFIELQVDAEVRKPVARSEIALFDLEKHAADTCTHKVFKKIRRNITAEQSLILDGTTLLGEQDYMFRFRRYKDNDETRRWVVHIDILNSIFNCECMMLQSKGIPCSHILSGFKSMGLETLPGGSIHRRWLLETGKRLRMKFPEPLPRNGVDLTEFGREYLQFVNIFQMLKQDDSNLPAVNELLLNLANEIEESIKKTLELGGHGKNSERSKDTEHVIQHVMKDPVKIRSKGAVRKGPRCCSLCKNPGHNKSTCPNRNEFATAGNQVN